MIDFAFDHLHDHQRGYPNLSRYRPQPYTTEWRQFDRHWPYVVPLRLILYLDDMGIDYRVWPVDRAPVGSIYPIAFSWFDFEMDYVNLIPDSALQLIKTGAIRLLFYYHEGDHPGRVRQRLDHLCQQHGLPINNTLLVSANSAARTINGCRYFDDSECWLWSLNRQQIYHPSDHCPPKDFTALSRSNKSWRACVMWDLYQRGLLTNSFWSYASDLVMIDDPVDNPLEYASQWPHVMDFLAQGPYRCDELDSDLQNDHHRVNTRLYTESKFHLVIETHVDADGSSGSLVTEKTYKCIKFGQPFIVIGTANTLDLLRDSGYRVFDHVIDNSYDRESNTTKRWHMILRQIAHLKTDLTRAWAACRDDCAHNARLFDQRPQISVNNLMQEIACHW